MKKLAVFSDSHGNRDTFSELLNLFWNKNFSADYYIFCGDGVCDFQAMKQKILQHDSNAQFLGTSGNCDILSSYPEEIILEIDGKRILITHGHRYNVKNSLLSIDYKAYELNCVLAIYGHTHLPDNQMRNAILFNPGSVKQRKMGYVEIQKEKPCRTVLLSF